MRNRLVSPFGLCLVAVLPALACSAGGSTDSSTGASTADNNSASGDDDSTNPVQTGSGAGSGNTSSTGSAGDNSSGGTGGSSGVGGSSSIGSGGSTGTGGSTGDAGSSGTGGSGTAGSAGSAGPEPYPPGPYGKDNGSVFPNYQWQGYRRGKPPQVTIQTADYYDPDGTKGYKYLCIVLVSGYQSHSAHQADILPQWQQQGDAKHIPILFTNMGTHTMADLDAYLHQPAAGVVSDIVTEGSNIAPAGGLHLPVQFIVDPKTMKILTQSQPNGDWVCHTDPRVGFNPT